MSVSKFLISSLIAAGFGRDGDATKATLSPISLDRDSATAPRRFTQDHYFTLAGHSSHSSHASHASHSSGYSGGHFSHTSHRSSSGGYDYSPRVYVPPVSSTPYRAAPLSAPALDPNPTPSQPSSATGDVARASPPAGDGLPALSGRSKRFEAIVRRVEIALMAQSYYKGPIDGVVSPALRGSLRRFQGNRKLSVTGTITPQTLDALQIAAQ